MYLESSRKVFPVLKKKFFFGLKNRKGRKKRRREGGRKAQPIGSTGGSLEGGRKHKVRVLLCGCTALWPQPLPGLPSMCPASSRWSPAEAPFPHLPPRQHPGRGEAREEGKAHQPLSHNLLWFSSIPNTCATNFLS